MKKRLLLLLLMISILFANLGTVTAVPSSVTFNYRALSGVNKQSAAPAYYKTVRAGSATLISYCLNQKLKVPASGTNFNYKSRITDAGMIYIYSNGYGGTWNTSLLGSNLSNDQRYYATQLAVWIYQGLSTSSLNKNAPEVVAAIKLSNAAKNAKTEKPNIDISRSSAEMNFDGKYYKSKTFTVSGSGILNYTVTLSNAGSSAQIVTTAGKVYSSGATLTAGTKFYVRIPDKVVSRDMNITVKVSSNAKVSEVYRYTINNSSYQDVGIMLNSTKSVSDSTTIRLSKEIEEAEVTIIKRDSSTNATLSGATLVLKDAKGNVMDRWVTNNKSHTVDGLEPGTYYLSEVKAPSGYTLNKQVTRITLSAGDSKTVTFYNTKTPVKSTVNIIKRDANTHLPLSGATLTLKNNKGVVIDTWVSTTKAHTIDNIEPGTYYLSEVKAPNGYVLNKQVIKIVLSTGDVQTVIMDNTPTEITKYNVNIIKKDVVTGNPLSGATLVLKDSKGIVVDTWVSTTKAHTINNLEPGTYTITEVKAPNGYILNSKPVKFSIVAGGEKNKTITFYNTPEDTKTTSVKISKQDITTKKELPGATLTLKDSNGIVVKTWVSTNKPHYITGLTPGKYTLIETKSPKGYGLSDEVIEFTINEEGKVDKEIIMYNSPIPETADINLVVIFLGFAGTLTLGGFGMYKLSKQN